MDINFKNGSKIAVADIPFSYSTCGISEGIAVSEDMGKCVAVSKIPTQQDIDKMMDFFGMDAGKMVRCPECPMKCQLKFMITHLNDRGETYSATYSTGWGKGTIKGFLKQEDIKCFKNHEWSFKQIGKWLESIGY